MAHGLAWDEEEVSLDQVPAEVRATLLKFAKGATIDEIERETKNGIVTYEAEWEVNGREIEVELTASGEVIGVEKEVAAADVPAAVRAVVAKKFPNGAKVEYEMITLHFYEVEGKVAGMEREILISPAGELMHAEEEDEHDDDDHDHDHDDAHDHDHD